MANINNINVNGTTYNIVDDEAMRLASNPTNQNILITNASGQAVDSGVSISEVGSGGTTIYDDSTAYDELTFETIASGVDTVKVGIDMDLLWTNSSPTSSFSAQTVSVDLVGYRMALVFCRVSTTNDSLFSMLFLIGYNGRIVHGYGESNRIGSRNISVSSSGVTFGGGSYNAASDNGNTIPVFIYGIR